MRRLGFEPTISAGERPKTYPLDRAATGTDEMYLITIYIYPTCYDSNKQFYEGCVFKFLMVNIFHIPRHKELIIIFIT